MAYAVNPNSINTNILPSFTLPKMRSSTENLPDTTHSNHALEPQILDLIANAQEYPSIDEVIATIPKGQAEMKPIAITETRRGIQHHGVICNPDFEGTPILFTPGLGSSFATTVGEKAIKAFSTLLQRPVINFSLLGYGAKWADSQEDWWKDARYRIHQQAISQAHVALENLGYSKIITAGNCAGGVIALAQAATAGNRAELVFSEKTPGVGTTLLQHSWRRSLAEVKRCLAVDAQAAEEKPSEINNAANRHITKKYLGSMAIVDNSHAIAHLGDQTIWGNVLAAGDGFTNPSAQLLAVAERERRLRGKNFIAVAPGGTHLNTYDYAMSARILDLFMRQLPSDNCR